MQEQRNKVEEVFDDIYVSFKIRVEVVSLILHGHSNSFNGVFGKNCRKLLLRNVVNCGSTCMALWKNSVLEVCQTQYFRSGHARPAIIYDSRYPVYSSALLNSLCRQSYSLPMYTFNSNNSGEFCAVS